MIIITAIIALTLLWIVIRLHDIEKEVEKGNKDSQEVKTRLYWLKQGINALQKHFKVKG